MVENFNLAYMKDDLTIVKIIGCFHFKDHHDNSLNRT